MACHDTTTMPPVWALVAAALLAWAIYTAVAAKRRAREQRDARQARLPFLEDAPSAGPRYDLQLADGRTFANVRLLGTTDAQAHGSALGDWGTLLVFAQASGKKTYVRPSAVRCIQEA